MNKERFTIDILDENNWLIQDTLNGTDANPIDGTTNVLKGLIRLLNEYYEENQRLAKENYYLDARVMDLEERIKGDAK